ncbi:hypothetical protein [Bacillus safensis]|nr:hypothetical protein [Bacillus safensis]UXC32632.1 hypothetical protein N4Q31_00510 [Bacillus safensis]
MLNFQFKKIEEMKETILILLLLLKFYIDDKAVEYLKQQKK